MAGRWYRSHSRRARESPSHRRRKVHSSTTCYSRPSSALLSILGTIAASSSNVNASPAPPPFLCPSFHTDHPPIAPFDPRHSRIPEKVSSYSPDPTDKLPAIARSIPDKYERGDDGKWRRVNEYTLYGSTVCLACGKPSSITAVDDEIQNVSSFSPGISPSASPSPTYDIRDSLPPGWKKSSNSSGSRTTFILVLSLVLAFVICFLIIGLVFWRKSRHRKHQQGDVEMKARRRRRDIPADEDREGMVQKDIKQKIWARATARWKANVRYTARQRRGKRIVPTSRVTPKTSFVSLEQSQFRTSSATSPPLSHRTSIESLYSNSPAAAAITSDPAPGQNEDQIQPSLASTSSHRLSCTSPPAYHQRLTRPQDPSPTEVLSDDPIPSSPSPFHAQRPSSSSGGSSGLDPSPYASLELSPIHAAHVATDDKSLLARLAELASSPPPSQEPVPADAQPSTPQVSAPVWQDEEFEDFPCDPGGSSSSRSPSPVLLFPPPPSKGKMAAPAFYDYSYSFEDIILKSEAGPSAPPFDDPPSAPPTDNIDLTPSAPPLMETDYYMEFHAAAPLHDDSLLHHRLEQEESHDQEVVIPSDSRPQTDMSVSDMDSFSTRVEGPVSSDGIPPRYYP